MTRPLVVDSGENDAGEQPPGTLPSR